MTRTDALLETERLMKNSGIVFTNKLGNISDEIAVSYLYDNFKSYAAEYTRLMQGEIKPLDYVVIIKQKIKQHHIAIAQNNAEKLFMRYFKNEKIN